jgi:cytochrome bd-type quinol oxidase subunit 1
MSSNVTVDRWQFTLTVMFHYLFPILTMGLALFIAWLELSAAYGASSSTRSATESTMRDAR